MGNNLNDIEQKTIEVKREELEKLMHSLNNIDFAMAIAFFSFLGKKRKIENIPAVMHSFEVGNIVSHFTENVDVISAGLLHDTLEDTKVTYDEIKGQFNDYVAELVKTVTEEKIEGLDPSITWHLRKERMIEVANTTKDINVKYILLADKLSNIRSLHSSFSKYGKGIWEYLNEEDPTEQYWYYKNMLKALEELSDTYEYEELSRLISLVFKEQIDKTI